MTKSLPQTITGCCFIPDGKDKSDAEGRQVEGYPAWYTLGNNATLTGRVSRKIEASEGVGDGREVNRVLTNTTAS